jgi:hypothetical protein
LKLAITSRSMALPANARSLAFSVTCRQQAAGQQGQDDVGPVSLCGLVEDRAHRQGRA